MKPGSMPLDSSFSHLQLVRLNRYSTNRLIPPPSPAAWKWTSARCSIDVDIRYFWSVPPKKLSQGPLPPAAGSNHDMPSEWDGGVLTSEPLMISHFPRGDFFDPSYENFQTFPLGTSPSWPRPPPQMYPKVPSESARWSVRGAGPLPWIFTSRHRPRPAMASATSRTWTSSRYLKSQFPPELPLWMNRFPPACHIAAPLRAGGGSETAHCVHTRVRRSRTQVSSRSAGKKFLSTTRLSVPSGPGTFVSDSGSPAFIVS
mmetsp:Transcript_54333/g.172569  ORF Transcript_54333/g.172569 Transcript_54333/m.172569 type:complete len:258 (+) Transcript_54333:410-1183(+)